jgi:hypothetical protein
MDVLASISAFVILGMFTMALRDMLITRRCSKADHPERCVDHVTCPEGCEGDEWRCRCGAITTTMRKAVPGCEEETCPVRLWDAARAQSR